MSFTSTLTHGVLKPGSGSATKLYRMNEKQRQGLINLGEQQINAVYEGGTAPFYQLASYTGQKFKNNLNRDGDMTTSGVVRYPGGQDNYGTSYYRQNRQGEFLPATNPSVKGLKRGKLFYAPTPQTFTGYNDQFFNEREKAYTDYAMPQVARQERDAGANLLYGLANRGQLGSSVAERANSDLVRTGAQARQAVVDNAMNQSSQLRKDLEQSRASALQNLYQASDPSRAVSQAISTSQQFRQPSTFAPIINAFASLANTYATNQAIQGYNRQAGAYDGADENKAPTYFASV